MSDIKNIKFIIYECVEQFLYIVLLFILKYDIIRKTLDLF